MDAAFRLIPMLFKGTDTVSGECGGRSITLLCSDIPYLVGKGGANSSGFLLFSSLNKCNTFMV